MGKKHAKTISEFELYEQFQTDEDAYEYLGSLRWGDEPHCVKCGCTGRITKQKDYKRGYWCGDCRSYFNAFTNTPLQNNNVRDKRKWIFAAYKLMTARKGISALQLKHELKVSYPTAWYMLHRLRLACGDDLEALHGEIEIDATYLGGKEENKHAHKKLRAGRGTVGKQAVLGMRERGGRTKAITIDSENQETIQGAVHAHIKPGSDLC